MAQLFFTYVPVEGYVSLSQELDSGEWGKIDTSPWEGKARTAAKPLGDAPAIVYWKLQIAWVIGALLDARGGAETSKDCDKAWDKGQKSLRALLTSAAASSDAKKSAAAGRLHKSLLMGAGEAQTKLKYREEVDFGRNQLKLVAQGQEASDIALLGLQPAMDEILDTTNALAIATGYDEGNERPSERLKGATAACATVCSAVANQLAWAIENGEVGADRQRAIDLRAPLEKLATRYPPPVQAPAPPVAAPGTPAPVTAAGGSTASGSGGKSGP